MFTTVEWEGDGYMDKMAASERCKPDYEGQVKSLREERDAAQELLHAAMRFGKVGRGQLTRREDGTQPFIEMIGALYVRIERLKDNIDRLLALMEKDGD